MTTPRETVVSLKVGDQAPKFSLTAHPQGEISLDDYIGKKNVILAFYPKDDTPGCTKEMCTFSDDLEKFNSEGTQVLGISCDDALSHEKFAGKYQLKLPLLADADGSTGRAYGAIAGDRKMAERMLFVIDKAGTIKHIHHGMPSNEELLSIVKNLK